MSAAQTDPNQLTLVVAGQQLTGWTDVMVRRGIELIPSEFDIAMTEKYPGQASQIVVQPGQPFVLMIGSDVVMTGYVDRYGAEKTATGHQVRASGRGKMQDAVDCSAGIYPADGAPGYATRGAQITTSDLLSLANDLLSPFGITASSLTGDNVPVSVATTGAPVQFALVLTETPYEIIQRVANYAGVLAYEGTDGNLILANVATGKHASGFQQGINAQVFGSVFSMNERYSIYLPVLMSTNQLSDLGTGGITMPPAYDTQVPRFRPLIVVSSQSQYGVPIAEKRAQWEAARRWGRSQKLAILCDNWRDVSGALWTPNFTASAVFPDVKVSAPAWVVSEVVFGRKEGEGTTAQVVMMPKDAFLPEPSILQLFDWQIGQELPPAGGGAAKPASGGPAAPATPPATGGAGTFQPGTGG